MTTPSRAPEIEPDYPTSYPRMATAWDHCWSLLACGEWLAAPMLAQSGATAAGVAADSVRHVLRRAVRAGLLDREGRLIRGEGGPRQVAFYRRHDLS